MRRSTRRPASAPGTSSPAARAPRRTTASPSYKAQVGNPPRTRWGDYGAAAVDGNSIWIASEYIATPCDYTTWGGPFFVGGTGDNLLGTCARDQCDGTEPRPGPANRARQLVDADQQVHAVVDREPDDDWRAGRKAGPPFCIYHVCRCVSRWQRRASPC